MAAAPSGVSGSAGVVPAGWNVTSPPCSGAVSDGVTGVDGGVETKPPDVVVVVEGGGVDAVGVGVGVGGRPFSMIVAEVSA